MDLDAALFSLEQRRGTVDVPPRLVYGEKVWLDRSPVRCVVWHAPPDAEPVTVAGTQAAVVLQLGTLGALHAGSDTTTCQTAYVQRFIVA